MVTRRATTRRNRSTSKVANKEHLEFDEETKTLVLRNPNGDQIPDRPVLDAMVAEGFFAVS